jgi:metal-responsive CopG/Arc/MetJ family transcriptional regulator
MNEPKKRRTHKVKMQRIAISISGGLLDMVDEAAEKDYTTRSDIIRTALLWYLRPQGRDLAQTDPDTILKTLQHRKALVGIKKMLDN